jgi:hypothetical protein
MDFTGAQRQPNRQTIAIDQRMDFARQATAGPSHRLALVPCDAGSMLMHSDNRGVDHLNSGIVSSGKCVYDAAPGTAASGRNGYSKWYTGRTPSADRAMARPTSRSRKCR